MECEREVGGILARNVLPVRERKREWKWKVEWRK